MLIQVIINKIIRSSLIVWGGGGVIRNNTKFMNYLQLVRKLETLWGKNFTLLVFQINYDVFHFSSSTHILTTVLFGPLATRSGIWTEKIHTVRNWVNKSDRQKTNWKGWILIDRCTCVRVPRLSCLNNGSLYLDHINLNFSHKKVNLL